MVFQAKIKVKELCDRKQLTLAKLARLSAVNYNTIYRWANQPMERLDADPLFRVCRVLECSLNELIEQIGDESIS